ncbi:MAG TPA: universal stress protein, partial [Streptosporangiaceae bacterium]
AIDRAFAEAAGGIPEDIDVTRRTTEGVPGHELVRVADRPDDLLVVGRERHLALHRVLRGSAAGYCVDHAVCRVLVVPAPETRTGPADEEMPSGIFY